MKCWIKFTSFPNEQALPLAWEIEKLSDQGQNVSWLENDDRQTARHINPSEITLYDLISDAESRYISESVTKPSILDIPQTPLNKLFAEVSAIPDAANLLADLNSSATFDKEESRHEVSKAKLLEKFDE